MHAFLVLQARRAARMPVVCWLSTACLLLPSCCPPQHACYVMALRRMAQQGFGAVAFTKIHQMKVGWGALLPLLHSF